MARDGAFDGTDVMITWHPMAATRIWGFSSLANYQVYFHFKGTSAHAAAAPEQGRSALDAAELMSVGVNYLREHIVQEARIHYAYIDAGGVSPNVVQPTASVLYFIRAPHSSQVKTIFDRVVDIARGAALMAGVTMELEWDSACSEYIVNDTLGRVMYENMKELGEIEYTSEEKSLAAEYVKTLDGNARESVMNLVRKEFPGMTACEAEVMASEPILGKLFPYSMTDAATPGSTDVGDASWIAPTVQMTVACFPNGTSPHSWQWVSAGKSSAAHKGMIYAAKAMAMTALDAIEDPDIVARAHDEFDRRLGGIPYNCAIPANVKPR
jgi:aminobenzoyl-glutamate utilization protein B